MFFFGVLLVFFLVWVAGGGPSRPISLQGPYLGSITAPSGFSQTTGGTFGLSGGYASVSFVNDTTGTQSKSASSEYVTIAASPTLTSGVSLAGWKLKSKESGKTVAFPAGTEVPRSGSVNASGAITLKPGDYATVVSGRSPVGSSFRESICTGYLEERQDFKPPLTQSCPTPLQELYRADASPNERCEDYVRSISYCSSQSTMKSPGGSCEAFVDEVLTYNGCVAAHRSDPGFSLSSWRIYLGASDDLWNDRHDTIELINADGAVVDSLTY